MGWGLSQPILSGSFFGGSQRDSMVYYKIQNINLQNTQLFSEIAELVLSVPEHEKDNTVLVVKLQKIVNYAGDNPLPKITYMGDSLT